VIGYQTAQADISSCHGSLTTDSKFVRLRDGSRTVAQTEVHKIYTGSSLWRVTPCVQFVLLYYLH
jgi:hypothetical protein